ncbi:hypothetical protein FSP39_009759 [Pinctada imbricata]|uniref:Uncharacterized protein n=1 Tax=Pinctada imbricata TaxID=66713 RepID=A0AA89C6M0_PINIB|nr:hypothetical protein FSP39_009759 [Pinctada imbricata]
MRHRQKLKNDFMMIDQLTPDNIELLNKLNDHPKIANAWYFNGHIYACDIEGDRRRFDVTDNVDRLLSGVKER